MHGGLLFAFADQIGATSIAKTQTEISILDLPSVSGTSKLDAKPLVKVQPKSDLRLRPVKKEKTNRLENSSEKLAAKSADNNAKLIEKVSKRIVANTIKDASSVQPVSSPKLAKTASVKNSEISEPVENMHETSEAITSERISEIISPISIAAKPQLTNTDTRPVAVKVLNRQDNKAKNLKPTRIAQPTKITKTIKTAELTSPKNKEQVQPSAAKNKIVTSKTTPTIASSQRHDSSKVKTFIPSAKSVQSIKTIPASISKLSKPKSIAAVTRVKTPKSNSAISTPKKLKTANAKPSNPVEISKNTVKQLIQKQNTTKLVSHIRIGRIKAVKSNANSNQTSSNSPSIKVAILARPRQIVPKALSKPTNDQIDGFAKIVNFLKFYQSENTCFLALPSISSQEKMILSGFSNEKSSWPNFQKALVKNTRFETPGRLASISDAQCEVITFARQSNSYPSYSVSLQLDFSSIKNGEFIAGKLFIDEGQYLNLLLIDDEGTAININRFVNIEKNNSTFQLQVNLTGGEVSTSQLLLAIVTDRLLDSMRSPEATPVSKLLSDIKTEIESKNISMDLALTAFEVK